MSKIGITWAICTAIVMTIWEIHFFFYIDWQWVTGDPWMFVFLYIPTLSWLIGTLGAAFISSIKGWSVEKDL